MNISNKRNTNTRIITIYEQNCDMSSIYKVWGHMKYTKFNHSWSLSRFLAPERVACTTKCLKFIIAVFSLQHIKRLIIWKIKVKVKKIESTHIRVFRWRWFRISQKFKCPNFVVIIRDTSLVLNWFCSRRFFRYGGGLLFLPIKPVGYLNCGIFFQLLQTKDKALNRQNLKSKYRFPSPLKAIKPVGSGINSVGSICISSSRCRTGSLYPTGAAKST